MWEALEDGDSRGSNMESISKNEKVNQESFWKGTYVIGVDMYSLQYSNCRNLSHASITSSIMVHCALTHTLLFLYTILYTVAGSESQHDY